MSDTSRWTLKKIFVVLCILILIGVVLWAAAIILIIKKNIDTARTYTTEQFIEDSKKSIDKDIVEAQGRLFPKPYNNKIFLHGAGSQKSDTFQSDAKIRTPNTFDVEGKNIYFSVYLFDAPANETLTLQLKNAKGEAVGEPIVAATGASGIVSDGFTQMMKRMFGLPNDEEESTLGHTVTRVEKEQALAPGKYSFDVTESSTARWQVVVIADGAIGIVAAQ